MRRTPLDFRVHMLKRKNTTKLRKLITLELEDNSHRVGIPGKHRNGPKQIIDRPLSMDTKFHILRSATKFRKQDKRRVNGNRTMYRDLSSAVSHNKNLKIASKKLKITVKDRQDRFHHMHDGRDHNIFGCVIRDTYRMEIKSITKTCKCTIINELAIRLFINKCKFPSVHV